VLAEVETALGRACSTDIPQSVQAAPRGRGGRCLARSGPFLWRQSDLLIAAAEATRGNPQVNHVQKVSFSLPDIGPGVAKLRQAGLPEIWLDGAGQQLLAYKPWCGFSAACPSSGSGLGPCDF